MALIRNILSPELQQKVEDDRRETERLFGLAPRWLARRLLVTARSIRQRSEKWMSHDVVYDAKLLWHLVPEVAYRLSERSFHD
jgi:hypothetical protein